MISEQGDKNGLRLLLEICKLNRVVCLTSKKRCRSEYLTRAAPNTKRRKGRCVPKRGYYFKDCAVSMGQDKGRLVSIRAPVVG